MNLLQEFEKEQLTKLTENKDIPEFGPGDTVRVNVKVVEGSRERVQAYEGVCIARKNAGVNSSFTVRKISYGEGVERVFPLYSPLITIEVVRRGAVRRAKLYYLRGLAGKKARIAEKVVRRTGVELADLKKDSPVQEEIPTEEVSPEVKEQVKAESSEKKVEAKKEAKPAAEKKEAKAKPKEKVEAKSEKAKDKPKKAEAKAEAKKDKEEK